MNEALKKNIETEIAMLKEVSAYLKKLEGANEYEKNLLNGAINSLVLGIRIINTSIPKVLDEGIGVRKQLQSGAKRESGKFENVVYSRQDSQIEVVLDKKSKERFLKELSISERYINQIKKSGGFEPEEEGYEFSTSRGYVRLANQFFLEKANQFIKKGYFKDLDVNLKKANFEILFTSYIATLLFSVVLSFALGIFLAGIFLFLDFNFAWPFVGIYSGDILPRLAKVIFIPVLFPVGVFAGFYYYPSSERKSIGIKINQELPFAVIHMSAISGSGIAPTEIFKIIGLSKDYPFLRKEIRKVLNQINLYGYDLITALINAGKTAPNENLAELFSGIATTITSGANLQNFFEKRSETLLMNYRLERERYTKVIETFLDIYISIVIAAPMVFLLLLILMVVSGIEIGLNSMQLSLISVFGIAVLNLFFLVFLQLKQPPY
jgi:pilus assembly protein TadC